jgi:hypothetical protein
MEQAPRDRDRKREEALEDATPAVDPPRPADRAVWDPVEVWAGAREPAVVPDRAREEAEARAAAGGPDKINRSTIKRINDN